MHDPALEILKERFGYADFRPHQGEIVRHVIDGGDALVLMPTGGGKSLCYQIPAMVRPGVGVVVSPLIALMKDQVDALVQVGARAAGLHSNLSGFEAREIEERLLRGELDLLYLAPERLMTPRMLNLLQRCRLALIAIDEAHCVSQWGHDFRPEYVQLSALVERFPGVPRIALTATADERTREEIQHRLQLGQARAFVTGFDRPNIRYRIHTHANARQALLNFIAEEHAGQCGIVYCLSRRKVETIAEWLCQQGLDALPYHAGLDPATRQAHQERFLRGDAVVIVATIAFG
ncbi:MAG: ATP-dependent DNA helicase RecQ, partial [Chromatiales bacterium]|nr:ATP-dependent DNA helicase RecQ [Chromatiales bacterium]